MDKKSYFLWIGDSTGPLFYFFTPIITILFPTKIKNGSVFFRRKKERVFCGCGSDQNRSDPSRLNQVRVFSHLYSPHMNSRDI